MSEIQKETAQELIETLKQVPTNKYHVLNQKLAIQFAEKIADDNLCNEAILSIQTDPEIDKANAERIVEFIEMIKSSRQNFALVQEILKKKEIAMINFQIISNLSVISDVIMAKFFDQKTVDDALELIGDSKRILFVGTPSTKYLVVLIEALKNKGVECIVRDQHDVFGLDIELEHKGGHEWEIRQLVNQTKTLLGENAIISNREVNLACSSLISSGEFSGIDIVIADPDPDGLLGLLKALGIVYPELDSDAPFLDGARNEQIPDKLSELALLLIRGMASLPSYDKDRPYISAQAKADYFSNFVKAVQGDIKAKGVLEQKTEAYENGVQVSKKLLTQAIELAPGIIFVNTTSEPRHDANTLLQGLAKMGAIVTVIKKSHGVIATTDIEAVQYTLGCIKGAKNAPDLRTFLPKGISSDRQNGIICSQSFMLHCNERMWKSVVLPALQNI